MSRFENIRFKGTFRSYQQRVLSNVESYLEDRKINIVTPPGSGKKVLGLELIRRLGKPCLILSPSKGSCEQWGQYFKDYFVEDESQFEELFSTDLHNPKLLNCITYQALYMAMERVSLKAEGEVDCSDINLQNVLHKKRIQTICLDEAHHLKNEYQRVLDKFLNRLDEDMKWICLTANPPAPADRIEWDRYYNICGKKDEEIYVPELVAQGDLCPHQDYVYFNLPSAEEAQMIQKHNEYVRKALKEIGDLKCMEDIADRVKNWNPILDHLKQRVRQLPLELEALLVFLRYLDKIPEDNLLQKQLGLKSLPQPNLLDFQKALQFLISEDRFWNVNNISKIRKVLEKYEFYKDKKVNLLLPEEIRNSLISSVEKLKSIGDITLHEYRNLGKDLRMLILTNYNRGSYENLSKIGTDESYQDISVVSIFETLRRLDDTMNIGVLSGDFIFLPSELVSQGTMVNMEPFEGTRYAKVEVYGSSREGMELVSELYREGKLQILIGTHSLLEEGWDEPCVNTLILAETIDPFHTPNQMRGGVIRPNPQEPHKVVNIWHLVTVEPLEMEQDTLDSCDYELVKQRFDTFMAPHYDTGEIQSGIDRVTLIRPPFDATSISYINAEMRVLSWDRSNVSEMWKKQLEGGNFRVVAQTGCSIENDKLFYDYLMERATNLVHKFWILVLYLVVLFIFCFFGVGRLFMEEGLRISHFLIFLLIMVICSPFLGSLMEYGEKKHLLSIQKTKKRQFRHGSVEVIVEVLAQTVQKTLKECGIIVSGDSVVVEQDKRRKGKLRVQLINATLHDQEIFNRAIREMMGPIEKEYPEYLLAPRDAGLKVKAQYLLACPTIITKNDEYIKIFKEQLAKKFDLLELVKIFTFDGLELIDEYHRNGYVKRKVEKEQDNILFEEDTKYIVMKEPKRHFLENRDKTEKDVS